MSVVKCTNCNVVINEILTFIQNQVDVMNENSIIRLCATSFSCQDVEAAKDLLYDSAQVKDKKIKRKGKAEVKVQKDVEDIISLIKSTPAECFPIFVARDIRKLPPVTFDHVDVSRLLKDIIILQDQVQDIKQRYATNEQLNDLKHEFVNLRQESLINNIEPLNYVNMKRGYKRTMQLENHETDSGPFGILNITHDNEQERVDFTADDRARTANREILSEEVIAERAETEILPSVSHTNRPSARAGVLGAAAIQSVEAPTVVSHAVSMVETKVALPMASPSSVRMSAERLEQKTSMNTCNELASYSKVANDGGDFVNKRDTEWNLVQRKRYRNRFMTTQGQSKDPAGKFKAADIKVPLFINNVDKNTTIQDMSDYIYSKTKINVKLVQINMKQEKDYRAYKVFVPSHKIDMFLDKQLWPEGIAFRRFVNFNEQRTRSPRKYENIENSGSNITS